MELQNFRTIMNIRFKKKNKPNDKHEEGEKKSDMHKKKERTRNAFVFANGDTTISSINQFINQ